jgi:SAM-dependent methyltransferase
VNREDWNRRYQERDFVWTIEPNRFVVEQTCELAPGRALDLGAGEGRNALWLGERGWRVVAVDFAEVGLERGRRLGETRGVRVGWVRADLTDYEPESDAVDLVLIAYLHLPWFSMRGVLHRAVRAVSPSGVLLLIGHDLSNLEQGHGGPRDPEVLYTPEALCRELSGLTVVEAARRNRPVETPDGEATAIDCLVRAERRAAM